jgi:hypothetical protein
MPSAAPLLRSSVGMGHCQLVPSGSGASLRRINHRTSVCLVQTDRANQALDLQRDAGAFIALALVAVGSARWGQVYAGSTDKTA